MVTNRSAGGGGGRAKHDVDETEKPLARMETELVIREGCGSIDFSIYVLALALPSPSVCAHPHIVGFVYEGQLIIRPRYLRTGLPDCLPTYVPTLHEHLSKDPPIMTRTSDIINQRSTSTSRRSAA